MPGTRRRAATALPLALLLLVLGACSGSEGSSPGGTPAPTPVPTLAPGRTPGPGVFPVFIFFGMTNDVAGTGDTPYAAISQAMTAYFDKVNAENGGVCGRDLALAVEDDQYMPELAIQKVREMVEANRVLGFVGLLSTPAHMLVAPYLNDPNGDGNTEDGVPDLFLSTGWSGWRDAAKYPWTTTFIPDYATDAAVLTAHINQQYAGKKVGIVYQDDQFGLDYLNTLSARLGDPSLLVAQAPFEAGAADLGPQVGALKDAGAEVVLVAADPEHAGLVFKAAGAQEYRPRFLVSYVNSPSRLAADIGGGTSADRLAQGFQALEGTVIGAYLLSPVEDDQHPAIVEHTRIMREYNGPEVSTLTVYAQALAETLVETVGRTCDDLSRPALMEAAESLEEFKPSLFLDGITITLSDSDHTAVQALQLTQIQADGSLRRLGAPITAE